MKPILTALFMLLALAPVPANASCIVPSVASARVVDVSHDGNLNHYRIEMTILNNANAAQASNTLQFVDIYHARQRLDAIGVPPLRPGGSYKAFYTFTRSGDAGDQTTTLHLPMRLVQPACVVTPPARTITF
jgi:hypothetical protein